MTTCGWQIYCVLWATNLLSYNKSKTIVAPCSDQGISIIEAYGDHIIQLTANGYADGIDLST